MKSFIITTFRQASKLGAMIALMATNLSAEEISSEAKHWNKVDQLIVDCDTAQSFGNDDQIKNAALELWQLTDIPFGLRASAESCVSEYLDGEAIFTWASGWEFLLNDDDLKVLGTAVLNIISEHRELCSEYGDGELQVPVTAIEKVDLTGNNEQDTVFHLGKVRCSDSGSYFSGSAGSFVYLIVEDKVTEFLARGFAVSYALGEGNPIIILSVHGSACGGYGATNCVLATVWGDNKFEVVSAGRNLD
jgi:hypothetical protein